ncbi:MAG TPA: hypothetical protein VF214_02225 [Edaphobacter sp.]
MPTNEYDPKQRDLHGAADPDNPGYEVSDVNVNGIVVFLSGLVGSLLVFFLVCFLLGRVINNQIQRADGPADKWHQTPEGKLGNLAANPEMQQRELARISRTFPEPRLEMDDGFQNTADLHAREDLFLNYFSSSPDTQAIRIPIDRAMELIAQRGLPVTAHPTTQSLMVGDAVPTVQAPLTTGFARTGYELDQIEAREQKMNFNRAESARVEK